MTDTAPGSKPLPLYQCHKRVRAFKIKEISDVRVVDQRSVRYLTPEDRGIPPIAVSCAKYTSKHEPEVGGYYVEHEDGYQSYSPAKAFEEGYNQVDEIAEFEKSLKPDPALVKVITDYVDRTKPNLDTEVLKAKADLYEHLVDWLMHQNLLHAQFCRPDQKAETADWWILRKVYMVSGDGCEGYGKSPEQAVENAFKDW
jgi:hypothetical protein